MESYKSEDVRRRRQVSTASQDITLYYIQYIKDYKELSSDMLDIISTLKEEDKMKIIREYNTVLKDMVDNLRNDN